MNPTCSVCLDALVAPVTFACGHSNCYTCYHALIKGSRHCPECRGNVSKLLKINIVLDQVLSTIVPDYEQLKKNKIDTIKRETVLKRYVQSYRFNHLKKALRNLLSTEGHVTMDQFMAFDYATYGIHQPPVPEEILYMLKEEFRMVKITLDTTVYYVSLNDLEVSHVKTFAMKYREEMQPKHLYGLFAALHPDVNVLLRDLSLTDKENGDLTCDETLLTEFLMNVEVIEKRTSYDDDSDDTSYDTQEEDDDEEDDDDEDDDEEDDDEEDDDDDN